MTKTSRLPKSPKHLKSYIVAAYSVVSVLCFLGGGSKRRGNMLHITGLLRTQVKKHLCSGHCV